MVLTLVVLALVVLALVVLWPVRVLRPVLGSFKSSASRFVRLRTALSWRLNEPSPIRPTAKSVLICSCSKSAADAAAREHAEEDVVDGNDGMDQVDGMDGKDGMDEVDEKDKKDGNDKWPRAY